MDSHQWILIDRFLSMDGVFIFVFARRRQIETGSETTRKSNAAVTFFRASSEVSNGFGESTGTRRPTGL
jgi:hypothetical protein